MGKPSTRCAELSKEMLYTKLYFEWITLTAEELKKFAPSDIWYQEREDFVGKGLVSDAKFSKSRVRVAFRGCSVYGQILEGVWNPCRNVSKIQDKEDGRFARAPVSTISYFRRMERKKILLLETSGEQSWLPEHFQKMWFKTLERYGLFDCDVWGKLLENHKMKLYYDEYKEILPGRIRGEAATHCLQLSMLSINLLYYSLGLKLKWMWTTNWFVLSYE